MSISDPSPDQQYDGVREIESILEEQYGIRYFDDEAGRALVQVRLGGLWSEPFPVEDLLTPA